VPPARLLQSLKGSTAREANRVLGRTEERKLERIAAYIENSQRTAGAETSLGAAG